MAGIFPKNACSAIIYYWPIDFYPSRVDLPTVSEEGAENVPNQALRRECSATRDFFDSQDIDKAGYFERAAKDGLKAFAGAHSFVKFWTFPVCNGIYFT